ncbi:MAG: Collagen alpha-5(VI) chain [Frankiales bacterium]|nr:Collagen alpha-5(VI) chain [Frankiales bacterium]
MTTMPVKEKSPLYPRLLRLRHVHPNAWQRALLGEGMAGLGALLVMADLASGWAIVVLPVAMAVVVKSHDVLAGWLHQPEQDAPASSD